ncbi:MAG TPA: sigma-70 family RNA polymerase sigma factor [Methylomirabilota bacterium]|jgi:RNA polymerase sigma-70 factor (ECF subfamily)|nr:sigma-70 family RNA polymerase sigma factor [Methylomirabilota bacterium]
MDQQKLKNLIIQAQSGDQKSLELVIAQFLPGVFGLCLRYMQNSFDAEDAAQETFVKAWKNLKKFDSEKKFQSWVLEIAKNTCLDILKKKRIIPFSAFEAEDGTNTLADKIFQPIKEFFYQPSLAKAIASLTPSSQKVLSLYYEQGLNFREISQELNESLDTVKSRHRRAIDQLKEVLI